MALSFYRTGPITLPGPYRVPWKRIQPQSTPFPVAYEAQEWIGDIKKKERARREMQ